MCKENIKKNQGLSLIELLVAIAILALAMSGVVGLINLASRYYSYSSKEVEIQSNLQSSFAVVSNLMVDADCGISYDSNVLRIAAADRGYLVIYSGNKLYLNDVTYSASDDTKEEKWKAVTDQAADTSDENNVLADHVDTFYVDASAYMAGYVKMGMAVSYGNRSASMSKNVFLRNSENAYVNLIGRSDSSTEISTYETNGKKYPRMTINISHHIPGVNNSTAGIVAGKYFYFTVKLAVTSGTVTKDNIKVETSSTCITKINDSTPVSVVSYNPTTGIAVIKGKSVDWFAYADESHKNEKSLVITVQVDKAKLSSTGSYLVGFGYWEQNNNHS